MSMLECTNLGSLVEAVEFATGRFIRQEVSSSSYHDLTELSATLFVDENDVEGDGLIASVALTGPLEVLQTINATLGPSGMTAGQINTIEDLLAEQIEKRPSLKTLLQLKTGEGTSVVVSTTTSTSTTSTSVTTTVTSITTTSTSTITSITTTKTSTSVTETTTSTLPSIQRGFQFQVSILDGSLTMADLIESEDLITVVETTMETVISSYSVGASSVDLVMFLFTCHL